MTNLEQALSRPLAETDWKKLVEFEKNESYTQALQEALGKVFEVTDPSNDQMKAVRAIRSLIPKKVTNDNHLLDSCIGCQGKGCEACNNTGTV